LAQRSPPRSCGTSNAAYYDRSASPPDALPSAARAHALAPDPNLPSDTRLWAALQNASGGTWGGCVCDADAITERLTGQ
jgi:hypothetical protein